MRWFPLKNYNGQFDHRGILPRLRRKLERAATQGECILVDGEDVEGLSSDQLHDLIVGLPDNKVRAVGFPSLQPFPLPTDCSLRGGKARTP